MRENVLTMQQFYVLVASKLNLIQENNISHIASGRSLANKSHFAMIARFINPPCHTLHRIAYKLVQNGGRRRADVCIYSIQRKPQTPSVSNDGPRTAKTSVYSALVTVSTTANREDVEPRLPPSGAEERMLIDRRSNHS